MRHFLNSLFVVLIEPSSSQKKIVIQQLEEVGITQFEAVDTGQEALAIIDTEQPDLVISAMFLDDMTGSELVNDMRDNPVTRDTPFMLISSETSFAALDSVKQAGASAVLPKPFSAHELKRAILMIMDWENPDALELNQQMQVLLVDDSRMARRMISRTLEKLGIGEITEAENGREAVPLLQSRHFDLVVTDYNMPEMDGHELLKFIRQMSNQPDVPVMMVTTEGDESKLKAVQHEGVSAIMDKPFDVQEVRSMMESVFSETGS